MSSWAGAQDPFEKTIIAAEAKTSVDREDWDLTWNMAVETGGWLVSKKIDIVIDIEAKTSSDRSRSGHARAEAGPDGAGFRHGRSGAPDAPAS